MSRRVKKLFERLDTDNDGRITLHDLIASKDSYLHSLFAEAGSARSVFLMHKFDHSHEGTLIYSEFKEFIQELARRGSFAARIARTFSRSSKKRNDPLNRLSELRNDRHSLSDNGDGLGSVWRTYTTEADGENEDDGGSRMFTSFFSGVQLSDSTVNLIKYATNSDAYTQNRISRSIDQRRLSSGKSTDSSFSTQSVEEEMTLEAVPVPP